MMKKLLIYIAILFSANLLSQPISLNSTNPHYFTYKGEPTIIVTSGEHYGALLNTDFNYTTYLNTLAADGLNGTRLSSGMNVEYPGWFDIINNTWAPYAGSYVCPWARSTTSGYYNGGNKFDLNTWDEVYFIRLKDFIEKAAANDIIVEFMFFSYLYNETIWLYNPMNYINNISGVGNYSSEYAYTTTDANMLAIQKAAVAKIVTELNVYDNIIWEICNEPYMWPPISNAWNDTIIKVITETEAVLNKQHLISENVNNFSYTITDPNPATDLFTLHYAYFGAAYTDNYGLNKALGNNETGYSDTVTTQYRQELYIALTSGASYFNNLDYTFTSDYPDGTDLSSRVKAGGGPTLRYQYKLAKDFIETFDFIDMAPDNSYINSAGATATATSIMEEGEQYAVFIQGTTTYIQIELPAGAYIVTWMDTKTGAKTVSNLRHEGGSISLYPPSYTDDIVLGITKYVAPLVESAPQSVYANGMYVKHMTDAVKYLAPSTDTTYIPPHPDQTMVFNDTITWEYEPYTYGGYGFYWWHRPDEVGITNYGDMPTGDWTSPHNYEEGNFTMTVEVISQPYVSPFYIQFGIWQDYGDPNYPESVAERQYVSGGAGSSGIFDLGSPTDWWQKEASNPLDYSRANNFYRIGVVLWNPDPLCIPKGLPWGSDGCPEYAYLFFPMEIVISVYASSDTTTIPPPPPEPDGPINIAIVGNSIAEGAYTDLLTEYPEDFKITDLAIPGAIISDMTYAWGNYAHNNPTKVTEFNWVAIAPLGINDIASGRSYFQMVTDYDSFISTIKADISSTCKILMYTMTPALGRPLGGGRYIDAAKNVVIHNVNENYIEAGPANVDVVSTKHWDDLKQAGYDTIHEWYNQSRDYIHPNWLGEQYMRENLLEDIGYLSDFNGTIFKEVTFAELVPDQTTDTRARIFLGSDDIERWEADSAYSDSTVVRINDQGNTDTVWQVKLVMPAYDGATGQGASWIGEMELNGVDNTDDTLTQYNFTYYIKLGEDWDWDNSTGGKLPGVMGMDADGDYGPGGNVFLCGCVPYNSYEYCWDDGFTARGGFDWYGDDIGFYSYNHQMDASLSCDNPVYGYSWNTARRAGSEAAGLDWELDKWYKITQRVDIGTAGSANGYMQMARNDTIMFSVENIKIIADSRIKADAWYLAAFSGGQPNTSYKGMHISFDDFILWQEEKRDAYAVGAVMTNVPNAKTPNTVHDDPPTPTPEDITVYWNNDWNDWPLLTTITKANLELYMDNFHGIMKSDGNDDVHDWVNTVDFNGERWLENLYPEGQCCTENGTYPIDYSNGGTGFDGSTYITDATTHYNEVYFSYDVWWDADVGEFQNADGMKLPGLATQVVAGTPDEYRLHGRLMAVNTSNGTSNLDPAYYKKAYTKDGGFYDVEGPETLTTTKVGETWFESDRKINITLRYYFGTADTYNGLLELYVDGKFIGGQGTGGIWPGDGLYSIPWYKLNDPNGFNEVSISTFMGGGLESYQSPKDQRLLLGLMKVWMYDDDVTGVPRGSTRSNDERDITSDLESLGFEIAE